MQKHSLFLAMAALLALGTSARERTAAQMKAIAQAALRQVADGASMAKPSPLAAEVLLDEPSYQVYGHSGGFVVVSRDDAFRPVLGLSSTPFRPDRLPCGLQWWLKAVGRSLEHRLEQQSAAVPWTLPREAAGLKAVAPYVSTTWGQEAPYYYKCPKTVKGTYTLTGCVATAMAQAMKCYAYPQSGTGKCTIKYNGKTKSVTLGTKYAWDDMEDAYLSTEGSLTKPVTAVATLMRDCGYSVNMDYDTSGSGAYDSEAARALVYNFQYDSLSVRYHNRAFYSDDEWRAIINRAIDDRTPVLIAASDPSLGGHEFLLCGRNDMGLVYVNWGWDGDADGYFDLLNLSPKAYSFTEQQSAIVGIAPPHLLPVERTYESQWAVYDTSYQLTPTAADELELGFRFLLNMSYLDFTGTLGLLCEPMAAAGAEAHYLPFLDTRDEDGGQGVPCYYGYGSDNEEEPMATEALRLEALPAGTYKVTLASQAVQETSPMPMRCLGGPLYLYLTKAADGTLTVSDSYASGLALPTARPTAPVRIYDLSGRLVRQPTADSLHDGTSPLRGVYVVEQDGRGRKAVRQ